MWKAREFVQVQARLRLVAASKPYTGSHSRPLSLVQQSFRTIHGRRLSVASLQLQFRRNFSIHHCLHQQSVKTYFNAAPQENKPQAKGSRVIFKIFHTIWRIFIGCCVFNLFILFFPILPEDLKYRYHKMRGGTDFADQLNITFVLVRMKKEPRIVFMPYSKFTNFVVVGKEEVRPLLDGEESTGCVLTLRPVEWIRRNLVGPPTMTAGGPGDPYERVSKRGPWGVEVENPKGEKKFYPALSTRKEDQTGDLRIEVGSYDLIGKYISGLRDGDLVMVAGPKREKTNQPIEVPI